ncbi:hypothetical protein F3Y22_tig00006743pilonHSYRG00004 [Hibiscus syriacus]|uniref:Reverse transcriptase Ty1/copia-type domain-containing protein n=1 Tax=Hibiscus syriacus TaxID=106335 RepID=A0A6A3CCI3_HIBSY|nr:hypothetical protein F3Y22_tig00006743pilonHSYRG00004 [Hibiscus syriacus]
MPPFWMRDYVSGEGLSEEENSSHFVLFATADPVHFVDAVKLEKWRKERDVEMKAIERNNKWEMVDLPQGAKKVGVKWVYKSKIDENWEVNKYKARLVVKGYAQQYGVDYKEVFAPVARMETIRLIIALTAQKGWTLYQLDVKSVLFYFCMGAKRVLRYLQGTTGFGIYYRKREEDGLISYMDSDYAGELDDRKSTSGNVILLSSGAISWSSKKQPVVSYPLLKLNSLLLLLVLVKLCA